MPLILINFSTEKGLNTPRHTIMFSIILQDSEYYLRSTSAERHISENIKNCRIVEWVYSQFYLRQLRPVLRSLTHKAARTLIQAFISSRLDYCNSLPYGVSDNLIRRVQYVQNAAARLLTGAGRRDHNLAGFAAVALAASSETRWLQTSMFCLLVFVWPRTSIPCRRHTFGLRRSSTAATLFHRQLKTFLF